MDSIELWTFDWVPDEPRGLVRDLRVRWAMEEAVLPHEVKTVPFKGRSSAHFAHQPFGQVPWIEHRGESIFESGAILFYLGELSTKLLPKDPARRSEALTWIFAALNSVETAAVPLSFFTFSGDDERSDGRQKMGEFLHSRLKHMDAVLAEREWLLDDFSVADIAMADVLRFVDHFDALEDYGSCAGYLARACARPAFKKALADQLEHFERGDREGLGETYKGN